MFVQQAEGSGTGLATTVVTGSITTGAGNRLVAFATYFRNPQTTMALTDSRGNTWTPIGSQQYNSGDSGGWQMFECIVSSAGATTFTCTYGASAEFRGLVVVEDDEGTGALDGSSYNRTTTTGTDAASAGSATNAAQPARHIAFCYDFSGSGAPAAGTGFTSRAAVWAALGAVCARSEDRPLTTTGSQSATFSPASGGPFYLGQAIFLNSAGGAAALGGNTFDKALRPRPFAPG